MLQAMKMLLPVSAAFGLVLGLSTLAARAQDKEKPAAKGNITGMVTDKDGKAVEGVTVNLMKPRQRRGGGAGGGGGQGAAPQSAQDHNAIELQQRGNPPPPVATATTDKDGKYEMKDVAAGDYMVAVREPEKKLWGRARVTVKDGETATADIKCSDTPPQRGGPGGGPRGPGNAGGGGGGNAKQ